jgi:hypothetical protein
MSSGYHHPQEDEFRKWSVPLPNVATHGTEGDIADSMEKLMPNEWHLEGNILKGVTKQGHIIAQKIPTNVVLTGTDEKGLPVFREISL